MSTTLTNGLKLPDKGSVDWYADMQSNYTILDGAVGTVAEHTTALSGKAADSDVVHKTGDETIAGSKTFASNIVIQGSKKVVCNIDNAFIELNGGTTWGKGGSIVLSGQDRSNYANSVLIVTKNDTDNFQIQYQNGSLKPVQGDNSLGTSTNQWKSVYAQSYYYNGTAWGLDKANTWSQVQTISYSGVPTIRYIHPSLDIGSAPASDRGMQLNFCDAGTNVVSAFQYIKGSGISRISIALSTKNSNNQIIGKTLRLQTNQEGTTWDFYPSSNGEINLGTSGNKWKTLNGINPGGLSLPDFNDPDPINTNTWVTSTPTNNSYTPSEDGWLNVIGSHASSANFSAYIKSGNFYVSNYTALMDIDDNTFKLGLLVPVLAGQTYYIVFKGNLALTVNATFYPAKGNV